MRILELLLGDLVLFEAIDYLWILFVPDVLVVIIYLELDFFSIFFIMCSILNKPLFLDCNL